MEEESGYIHSAHNVSNLIYHFVTPTKYRRLAITEPVEECIQQICAGIELRYDWIRFLEVGADGDHVHWLVQSTPEIQPDKDNNDDKEHNGQAHICGASGSEEDAVGRIVLERRVFCVECGEEWKRERDKAICKEPGQGAGIQTALS